MPFDVSGATVYRGGSVSNLGAIGGQDVVYWSGSMRTLWAYSNRVTGTCEKASPSGLRPHRSDGGRQGIPH